jgi:DNA-binding NarL/FixJ family response regulator
MNEFSSDNCAARVQALPEYLREVLRRVALGQPTKQIAAELDIKESTVLVYRERMYSRLGVNNVASATRVAVVGGLV